MANPESTDGGASPARPLTPDELLRRLSSALPSVPLTIVYTGANLWMLEHQGHRLPLSINGGLVTGLRPAATSFDRVILEADRIIRGEHE